MKLLSERVRLVLKENPELEGDEGQSGLVNASGASKSVVNQWISGKIKSMRLDYALNIERKLGYNHIWLVLGIEDKKVATLRLDALTGQEGILIGMCRSLSSGGRTALLAYANRLVSLERNPETRPLENPLHNRRITDVAC